MGRGVPGRSVRRISNFWIRVDTEFQARVLSFRRVALRRVEDTSVTARTRLTLQQLDGRDLPSTVAVTVERPAEYASASIEYQQAFDQAVQESLQGVVVETFEFVAAPVAENAAAPAEAGDINFTPAERNEIIALDARLREIDRQLAENAAARAQLQGQIDPLMAVLSGLQADLAKAEEAFRLAARAYNEFLGANPSWLSGDQATVDRGLALLGAVENARGRIAALDGAIAGVQGAIADIRARIDALHEHDGYLRDIRYNIDYRIRVIIDRARAGLPNSPPAWFPELPSRFAPRTAASEF